MGEAWEGVSPDRKPARAADPLPACADLKGGLVAPSPFQGEEAVGCR